MIHCLRRCKHLSKIRIKHYYQPLFLIPTSKAIRAGFAIIEAIFGAHIVRCLLV